MPDCKVRSNVTNPTKATVGNSTSPKAKNAPPTPVAVATSPQATSPPETDAKNVLARPVDSAIVAERAPCRVKCSVVMNETAEAGFAARIGGLLFVIRHDPLRNRRATGWGRTRRPCTPALGPLGLTSTAWSRLRHPHDRRIP